MTTIAFIGFGEAGGLLVKGLRDSGADVVAAYDILIESNEKASALREKAAAHGIVAAMSAKEAVIGADVIISAVVSSETITAASGAAPHLREGQIYMDMNSSSPAVKREAAALIEKSGADFVESAVMDLVPPHGHQVPMLLAGKKAAALVERLSPFGMDVTAIGETIGNASSVKMVRSVFMKGFTAILLESLYAAKQLDAEDHVLDSLQVTFPEIDWEKLADYYASRLIKHARRQGIEMHSVAETLKELGVDTWTVDASAARLGWLADMELEEKLETLPKKYGEFLDILKQHDRP